MITLRIGRIEQWAYEADHELSQNIAKSNSNPSTIPDNSTVIDMSVLTSIISRLDSLETAITREGSSEDMSKLKSEVTKLSEQLTRFSDEGNKHNLAIAKHGEQIFKFDRDLVETKDLLKTFMLKYDAFVNETNDRFGDFELALSEVEKSVQATSEPLEETNISTQESATEIESADLKALVKRELAEGVASE